MNKTTIKLIIISFFLTNFIIAQNPIIKDIGMSDPHVRIFNDTIYLYTGKDDTPEDKTWVMKNWMIFSSTDLVNWKKEGIISPKDNYMDDNSTECWAGDAAFRNGKYYFYFSDRSRSIGVMEANSPTGHFKDPIGKPLVSMHDPTILIDDDKNKTPYIIYGSKEHSDGFHIAKLNENMISLAEKPKLIIINGKEWENSPKWMDKNYIFKHKDTYYLSWGRDYAISKNIYGPYQCVGALGNGHHLSPYAHGSFFEWKGQFYHVWCYYIKSGYKYRESIITYCHFDDEGKIVTDTDFLDNHFEYGVARYNAAWQKIEAEWYYEISGNIQKQGNRQDGFVLSNIKNDNWITFSNVTFDKKYTKFVAQMALPAGGKTCIEIRTDSPTGKRIGKIKLSTPEAFPLQEVSCKIKKVSGNKDLFLFIKGNENTTVELDWFKFEE